MSVRITGAVLVGTRPVGLFECAPHAAATPKAAPAATICLSDITG
jgi:hypothetical protein